MDNVAATPATVPVTVGQIITEADKTDVHVVVFNAMQSNVQNIVVRCDAIDAQGLAVAQTSTTIPDIPALDVAFGEVLFPSQITISDNRFSCVAQHSSGKPIAPK